MKCWSVCGNNVKAIGAEVLEAMLDYAYAHNDIALLEKLLSTLSIKELNNLLVKACIDGLRDIVIVLIEKGATALQNGLKEACKGGHTSVVQLLVDNQTQRWDGEIVEMREQSDTETSNTVLHNIVHQRFDYFNAGLISACENNQLAIVKLMVDAGANDLFYALYSASSKNNMSIVEYLLSLPKEVWVSSSVQTMTIAKPAY